MPESVVEKRGKQKNCIMCWAGWARSLWRKRATTLEREGKTDGLTLTPNSGTEQRTTRTRSCSRGNECAHGDKSRRRIVRSSGVAINTVSKFARASCTYHYWSTRLGNRLIRRNKRPYHFAFRSVEESFGPELPRLSRQFLGQVQLKIQLHLSSE